MTKRNIQVVILCEDRQQEVFARRFLIDRGFNRYRIRANVSSGSGSGEQYVRRHYPQEVKALYRQQAKGSACLIVFTDADIGIVDNRIRQLKQELENTNFPKEKLDKVEQRIGIFVPRRNIETWIYYLQGQEVDEETAYVKLAKESDCEPAIKALVEKCNHGIEDDAPSSLLKACEEWQKLAPSMLTR